MQYAYMLAPTPHQPPSHGDGGKGSRWSRGTVKTGPLRKNNYFEALKLTKKKLRLPLSSRVGGLGLSGLDTRGGSFFAASLIRHSADSLSLLLNYTKVDFES